MSLSLELQSLARNAPKNARLIVTGLRKWFYPRRGLTDTLLGRPSLPLRAVDGVSFNLREKETYGLVGESGCGKTTLGRLVARLIEPTDGVILYRPSEEVLEKLDHGASLYDGFVDMVDLKSEALKEVRKEISMIFQDPYSSMDPRYTVKGILEEPLIIQRAPKDIRMKMITSMMEEVKLLPVEDFLYRHPHMLSGGQRQRLGIARALILGPSLVIADEPVSMLDVSIRAEILELMMEEKAKRGLTYIFISHDLAVARHICDSISVMYLGKIVEEGPVKRVITRPSHPYTCALIAAIPTPDPESRFKMKELPIYGEIPSATNIPSGCRFNPRCPYAPDKSRFEEPPSTEVEEGHYSACWRAKELFRGEICSG